MRTALLCVLLLMPACAARKPAAPPTPVPAAGRTFVGALPCPFECDSVRTEITFFDQGHRFAMEETFLGLPDGNQIERSFGEWTILRGHGGNPTAEVYELISEQFEEERYFLKVGDDVLRALDDQGRDIRTTRNVMLRKVNGR